MFTETHGVPSHSITTREIIHVCKGASCLRWRHFRSSRFLPRKTKLPRSAPLWRPLAWPRESPRITRVALDPISQALDRQPCPCRPHETTMNPSNGCPSRSGGLLVHYLLEGDVDHPVEDVVILHFAYCSFQMNVCFLTHAGITIRKLL